MSDQLTAAERAAVREAWASIWCAAGHAELTIGSDGRTHVFCRTRADGLDGEATNENLNAMLAFQDSLRSFGWEIEDPTVEPGTVCGVLRRMPPAE
jgi:hypothetical protein